MYIWYVFILFILKGSIYEFDCRNLVVIFLRKILVIKLNFVYVIMNWLFLIEKWMKWNIIGK